MARGAFDDNQDVDGRAPDLAEVGLHHVEPAQEAVGRVDISILPGRDGFHGIAPQRNERFEAGQDAQRDRNGDDIESCAPSEQCDRTDTRL